MGERSNNPDKLPEDPNRHHCSPYQPHRCDPRIRNSFTSIGVSMKLGVAFHRGQFRSPSLLVLLILALFNGCNSSSDLAGSQYQPARTKLAVAAAANLKFAFDEVEAAFERQYPKVEIVVTYGSSGNFFAQLCQRAAFDIFFSADTRYPRKLVEQKIVHEGSYFPYASGRIVVWIPKASPLNVEALQMRALLDPSVRKIAIANPRLAPYGVAAEEALKTVGVYEQTKDRLVLGESIAQTAAFVESGAADVGILALSLALSPGMKQRGKYWEIPAAAHAPIDQAAVIPVHCRAPEAARQLRAFILGPVGQTILARYGYALPQTSNTATSPVKQE